MFSNTRFDLPGKTVLHITANTYSDEPILAQTSPVKVTAGRGRVMLNSLLKNKTSTHSGRGSTLWVLVEYCKAKGVPYCLTGTPNEGYIFDLLK